MKHVHTTDSLVEFCIAQRGHFAAQEWIARRETDGKAVSLAARYLSMTSWYGHAEELEQIAARTCSAVENSPGLHQELRKVDFDLATFSAKVRRGISLSHAVLVEPPTTLPAELAAGDITFRMDRDELIMTHPRRN